MFRFVRTPFCSRLPIASSMATGFTVFFANPHHFSCLLKSRAGSPILTREHKAKKSRLLHSAACFPKFVRLVISLRCVSAVNQYGGAGDKIIFTKEDDGMRHFFRPTKTSDWMLCLPTPSTSNSNNIIKGFQFSKLHGTFI
jgi:hypothetical protein